ncbi:hypothetical protein V8F06_009776 [Rhypophila decipiens]
MRFCVFMQGQTSWVVCISWLHLYPANSWARMSIRRLFGVHHSTQQGDLKRTSWRTSIMPLESLGLYRRVREVVDAFC